MCVLLVRFGQKLRKETTFSVKGQFYTNLSKLGKPKRIN